MTNDDPPAPFGTGYRVIAHRHSDTLQQHHSSNTHRGHHSSVNQMIARQRAPGKRVVKPARLRDDDDLSSVNPSPTRGLEAQEEDGENAQLETQIDAQDLRSVVAVLRERAEMRRMTNVPLSPLAPHQLQQLLTPAPSRSATSLDFHVSHWELLRTRSPLILIRFSSSQHRSAPLPHLHRPPVSWALSRLCCPRRPPPRLRRRPRGHHLHHRRSGSRRRRLRMWT